MGQVPVRWEVNLMDYEEHNTADYSVLYDELKQQPYGIKEQKEWKDILTHPATRGKMA